MKKFLQKIKNCFCCFGKSKKSNPQPIIQSKQNSLNDFSLNTLEENAINAINSTKINHLSPNNPLINLIPSRFFNNLYNNFFEIKNFGNDTGTIFIFNPPNEKNDDKSCINFRLNLKKNKKDPNKLNLGIHYAFNTGVDPAQKEKLHLNNVIKYFLDKTNTDYKKITKLTGKEIVNNELRGFFIKVKKQNLDNNTLHIRPLFSKNKSWSSVKPEEKQKLEDENTYDWKADLPGPFEKSTYPFMGSLNHIASTLTKKVDNIKIKQKNGNYSFSVRLN